MGNTAEARRHALEVAAIERWPHLLFEADVQHAARLIPGLEGLLALLVASALAVVGFLAFPTAPPRLAGIGVADTVSSDHVDLNTGLVSSLYNPYAAVPSMHIGYALIVAASVLWWSRRALVRVLAPLYPPFVLLVVVATGNHFFLDAAAGALVAGLATAAAALLTGLGLHAASAGRPWRAAMRS